MGNHNQCTSAKSIDNRNRNQSSSTHHSFSSDKLALNVGNKALIESHGRIIECTIQNISYDRILVSKPTHTDLITVAFDNHTTKSVNRYELRLTPLFRQKRNKLALYCMVEVYAPSLKQWIPGYIRKYGTLSTDAVATNGNRFCVNGTNYDRWSHRIRCYSPLLSLGEGSSVSIFDADTTQSSGQWIPGRIVHLQNPQSTERANQHLDLTVYIVEYYKKGVKYYKYVHEFSASLASTDCDDGSLCSVTDEYSHLDQSRRVATVATSLDATDLRYHRMLFEGLSGSHDVDIHHDVLCQLIQFMEFRHDFIMTIESKTCSLALQCRDNIEKYPNLRKAPNPSTHTQLAHVLRPRNALHQQIQKKLREKGRLTPHNFMRVVKSAQERPFPMITKEDADHEYHNKIMPYHELPFPTESELVHQERNGYDSGDTESSLESGSHLELQTDIDDELEEQSI